MNTFEKLKSAKQTKAEMLELAKDMKDWKIEDYNKALDDSMEQYEGRFNKNLLMISGINKVKLDPFELVTSIPLMDEARFLYYAFAHQGPEVIPFLCDHAFIWSYYAQSHAIVAINIAVELAIKFDAHREKVHRNLRIIKRSCADSDRINDLIKGEKLLMQKKYGDRKVELNLIYDPIPDLSEEEIESTRLDFPDGVKPLCEINKVNFKKLTYDDLVNYIQMTANIGAPSHQWALLSELKNRNHPKFKEVVYLVYLHCLLRNQHEEIDWTIKLIFGKAAAEHFQYPSDIVKNWNEFSRLEMNIRDEIDSAAQYDLPLSYLFEYSCPALSIIFSRAAMILPDIDDESMELLVNRIKQSRIQLDLEPDDDPIFKILKVKKKNNKKYFEIEETINDLKSELSDTIKDLNSKNKLLEPKNKKINTQEKRIAALEKEISDWKQKAKGDKDYQELEKKISDLAFENEKLRMKHKTDASIINELKLENNSKPSNGQVTPILPESTPENEPKACNIEAPQSKMSKDLIIPVISDAFMAALYKLDKKLRCKAWDAGHGLAASREDVIKATTQIKDIPGYSRIKFNGNYRILVKYDPGKELELVDIINRKDLETWIKNQKN
jgi:hypothetical protein